MTNKSRTNFGTWKREAVPTPERAWEIADHLAQEAFRLGQAGDLAHTDSMLESIRYEIRALTLAVRNMPWRSLEEA